MTEKGAAGGPHDATKSVARLPAERSIAREDLRLSGLAASTPAKARQADTTQGTVASRTGGTGAEHVEFVVTPAPDGSVEHGAEQAAVAASTLTPAAATAGTLGGTLSAAAPAAAASAAAATPAAASDGSATPAAVLAGLAAAADDLTPADVGMRRQQRLRIGWHTTSLTGLARLSSLVDGAFTAAARGQVPAGEAAPASSPELVALSPALVSPTAHVAAAPAHVASPPAFATAPPPVRARSKRLAMIPTVVVAGALAFAVAVWASKGLKEDGVGADPIEVCLSSECIAWAGFTASTNVLKVCDKRADSVAAVAIYTIGGSAAQRRLWDSGGAGNCSESTLNVAEGTAVTYQVCSGDQSEARIDECSDAITNYA